VPLAWKSSKCVGCSGRRRVVQNKLSPYIRACLFRCRVRVGLGGSHFAPPKVNLASPQSSNILRRRSDSSQQFLHKQQQTSSIHTTTPPQIPPHSSNLFLLLHILCTDIDIDDPLRSAPETAFVIPRKFAHA